MRDFTVAFCDFRTETVMRDSVNAFAFRKDKKHHWLQKACLYILNKVGAHHVEYSFTATRYTISPSSFIERLNKMNESLFRSFNARPYTLLIGAEDFSEMMGSEELRSALAFRMDVPMRSSHGRHEIMGLTVKVIPWMKGMVVMPDDDYFKVHKVEKF